MWWLNWRIWAAVSLACMLAGVGIKAYKAGEHQVQQEFEAYKTQELRRAIKVQEQFIQDKQVMDDKNQKVGQDYEQYKKVTSNSIKSLDAERMRLIDAISSYSQAASSPTPEPFTYAVTKDKILGECTARYAEVAGDADRLSDQVLSLQQYIREVVRGKSEVH